MKNRVGRSFFGQKGVIKRVSMGQNERFLILFTKIWHLVLELCGFQGGVREIKVDFWKPKIFFWSGPNFPEPSQIRHNSSASAQILVKSIRKRSFWPIETRFITTFCPKNDLPTPIFMIFMGGLSRTLQFWPNFGPKRGQKRLKNRAKWPFFGLKMAITRVKSLEFGSKDSQNVRKHIPNTPRN